jgi:hypothetical protein
MLTKFERKRTMMAMEDMLDEAEHVSLPTNDKGEETRNYSTTKSDVKQERDSLLVDERLSNDVHEDRDGSCSEEQRWIKLESPFGNNECLFNRN